MNEEPIKFDWIEKNELSKLHIMMIYIIPQILYIILCTIKFFEFGIEFIILWLFSSSFAIMASFFLNKSQFCQIEILSSRVEIRVANKSNYNVSELRQVNKIIHGLFVESINYNIILDFVDIESIGEGKRTNLLVFMMKNGKINSLKIGHLAQENRKMIFDTLSESLPIKILE